MYAWRFHSFYLYSIRFAFEKREKPRRDTADSNAIRAYTNAQWYIHVHARGNEESNPDSPRIDDLSVNFILRRGKQCANVTASILSFVNIAKRD